MYTPRHLRKKHRNNGGTKDPSKRQSFRRAAQYSKRFIFQSASMLEKMPDYPEYCEACRRGVLRKA